MATGHLWPAHPKPFPDELLSSWFVRLAEANGIKLQTLSWMLFGYGHSPWQRDVDRTPPDWFLDAIKEHAGLDRTDAWNASLDTYRTRLYPKPRSSGMLRWVLPIVSAGASRRGFGMQFCPECLDRDTPPYYRKQWRLALFTYCPKHNCFLYDACPACGAPVAYFRYDFGREISQTRGITFCWKCEVDFRNAARVSPVFPARDVGEIFGAMLRSLESPTAEIGKFDLGFFAVLHQLCRVMGMTQNKNKLLAYVAKHLCTQAPLIALGRISIEERRIEERHALLLCALWLLADLEHRLRAAWFAKAVRYNLMVRDFHDPPRWYFELAENLLLSLEERPSYWK